MQSIAKPHEKPDFALYGQIYPLGVEICLDE